MFGFLTFLAVTASIAKMATRWIIHHDPPWPTRADFQADCERTRTRKVQQ